MMQLQQHPRKKEARQGFVALLLRQLMFHYQLLDLRFDRLIRRITPTSLERVDHIHFPMKEAALLTNLFTKISRKNALDGSFAPESTTRQQSKWITFALGIPH